MREEAPGLGFELAKTVGLVPRLVSAFAPWFSLRPNHTPLGRCDPCSNPSVQALLLA
ncbi:MAG: hypothetical protein ACI8VE_000855 [Natrialbaceae archaeon]|jgi:hypothetical protein